MVCVHLGTKLAGAVQDLPVLHRRPPLSQQRSNPKKPRVTSNLSRTGRYGRAAFISDVCYPRTHKLAHSRERYHFRGWCDRMVGALQS